MHLQRRESSAILTFDFSVPGVNPDPELPIRLEDPRPPGSGRALRDLATAAGIPGEIPDVTVTGVTADTRTIEGGELFVAISGTTKDGHDYVEEAVERGAAAVVVERAGAESEARSSLGVPVLRVPDSREALAAFAAAWFGHPARSLPIVGISGTLGKTSVLTMMEAILGEAGVAVGAIGSLGVHLGGRVLRETGHTAPDPMRLHESLALLRDGGSELVVMEVTSHALAQKRVQGLRYGLGVFTNLVPLEHADYHGSFAGYVEAKSQFFDHLAPGAPLVYAADDPVVAAIVSERGLTGVAVGPGDGLPLVRISSVVTTAQGTSFRLAVPDGLPSYRGRVVERQDVDIRLRLLGASNVSNAALAAVASLFAGAPAAAIATALAGISPPRRRLEIIHDGEFRILDDTVGHPDSISAVFGVLRDLRPERVHIVYAVRGMRGAQINTQMAEALSTWAANVAPATLIITRSEEAADERNRVQEEERAACSRALEEARVEFQETDRLDDAVRAVLEAAGPGDLVLLLGAQGMDAGGAIARDWLSARGA